MKFGHFLCFSIHVNWFSKKYNFPVWYTSSFLLLNISILEKKFYSTFSNCSFFLIPVNYIDHLKPIGDLKSKIYLINFLHLITSMCVSFNAFLVMAFSKCINLPVSCLYFFFILTIITYWKHFNASYNVNKVCVLKISL